MLARLRIVVWIAALVVGVVAAGLSLFGHWFRRGSAGSAERFAYGALAAGSSNLPELWEVPEFALHDQRGVPVARRELVGHIWIADFIFTTCTSVCPLLSARMRLLQRRLPDPQLRFVSFSVDPQHDTTEALQHYADSWNRREQRWLLLRTEPASLNALVQGMRVVADATGDAKDPILHSKMFFLVDRAGRVRGVYDSDDDQALQRLASDTRVLSARAAPTASVGAGSAEAGQALFLDLGCSGCHDNPRLAPSLRGAWGRQTEFAGGGHTIMDAAYVRESIVAPGAKVVDGYLNLMPAYANEMSAAELDNLIEYVRSLAAVEVPPVGASTLPSPALTALPPLKPTAVEHSIAVRAPTQLEKDPPSSSSAASAPGVGARIAIDPVCGMSVRADPSTPHAVQASQDYYFCSESCREQFVTDPSKYAAKPRSAFP